jgi:EAL and modified HD-GYP domain-containing signal transduction protein
LTSFLVTRRPVFDRVLDLTAYELLVGGEDGDEKTGDVVSSLVLEVASDGDLASILGEHPAWLTLSVPAAREAAGASLGKRQTTIELRADGREPAEVRSTIADLRARGHAVAIETDPRANGSAADLLQAADIAAVDVAGMGASQMAAAVESLKPARVAVAATNVDAPERHEEAHAAGFDLFRGEFFKKPRARPGGGIPPSRLTMVRLLGALQEPNIELSALATLVSQDVGLTYRLLRYINSAFFGMRREVTSISHAVALLGLRNVKRWATVMMLADVDHRPRELLTTALVRARFCELAGPYFRESDGDELFTLGLFSVLDALLDTPMNKALRPLPLTEEMVRALTLHSGTQGKVLACALSAERGERCEDVPVDADEFAELYRKSLEWASESSRAL